MFKFFGRGRQNSISSNKSNSSELSTTSASAKDDAIIKKSKLILKQAHDFEIALQAMDYLLDDRTKLGFKILNDEEQVIEGKSESIVPPGCPTILVLATGVIEFLEATLGFESSVILKAGATLGKAEQLSLKAQQYNIKYNLKTSHLYPPGTEFQVTYTESCLLNALLMLFSESMMESAKALLKLKKAYNTLQEILKLINKAQLEHKSSSASISGKRPPSAQQHTVTAPSRNPSISSVSNLTPATTPVVETPATNSSSASISSRSGATNIQGNNQSGSTSNLRIPNTPTGRLHSNSVTSIHSTSSSSSLSKSNTHSPANNASQISMDVPYKFSNAQSLEETDKELLEFADKIYEMRDKRLCGSHIGNPPASIRLRTELGISSTKVDDEDGTAIEEDIDVQHTYLNGAKCNQQCTVDEFIHSGVNLCFGILQVILSLLPPAIGAVLSVIGVRGNREDGLRMVWKCVKERNIHGGLGLSALLFYYNGPFQFVDDDFDIPLKSSDHSIKTEQKEKNGSEDVELTNDLVDKLKADDNAKADQHPDEMTSDELLHPGIRLERELLKARAVFPNSALWLLQESMLLSKKGKLKEAVELMDSIDATTIEMKQVKAQLVFTRAITLVHLHEFERAAQDFLYLIEINEWSHAFYTYFAGCCYLENYRMCQMNLLDSSKKEYYHEKAVELIFSAPNLLNKKKWMAKNLPFDRFMQRKVDQIKAIQSKHNIKDPLDAIATSPVHELSYLYQGFSRMDEDLLKLSLKLITEYENPATELKLPDQEMIKNFMTAVIYRRIGRVEEGCRILDTELIPEIIYDVNPTTNKTRFNKLTQDPWLYPSALYERALFSWKIKNIDGLTESRDWLQRALDFAGDYELSTRVGMRVKAALGRVQDSLSK
ncbi:related to Mitochondrial outer membrane protein SCY_3392 [Saccharomycodes ludwigii]|uniref:Related to Mitochondrial outer membrane protein SCY_3392 n=1 Tax=Saccharomycodes ludwigii TaxID=36035 RepID=A0A376BAA9_9ASCO|nr:hypothetical protein SCDLUD_003598 [Saccharomycodes ludwigii]KAH3900606.1 hypothetical protein SCDLUD_003598 [Saccharomycodes ludwigii]SSD61060.1 related to Mitochondrial outer membrane protein SCY_3392 [Saccharomycodes ludwigii]